MTGTAIFAMGSFTMELVITILTNSATPYPFLPFFSPLNEGVIDIAMTTITSMLYSTITNIKLMSTMPTFNLTN